MVSTGTTTLRAGIIGSQALGARLLNIANPRSSGRLSTRLAIDHIKWDTSSVTSYIEGDAKPEVFFIDYSNEIAARRQLDELSRLALNGVPFLGVTSIDPSKTANTLLHLMELKRGASGIGAEIGGRHIPLLSDIVDVSSLEQMATSDPIGAHHYIFDLMFRGVEICQSRHNSLTDNLTGLPSERAFDLLLTEGLKLASREEDESTALVFADLRAFKAINDTYGHTLADQVLKRFAQIFREGIRDSDVVARPHGDEFYFMFPRTTEEAVRRILGNMLTKVTAEVSPFADIHPDLRPGVNFGAFIFSIGAEDQRATLYALAQKYIESIGGVFKPELLGSFLVDTADKLSYLSRKNGENQFELGHTADIPRIQDAFAEITAHGRSR